MDQADAARIQAANVSWIFKDMMIYEDSNSLIRPRLAEIWMVFLRVLRLPLTRMSRQRVLPLPTLVRNRPPRMVGLKKVLPLQSPTESETSILFSINLTMLLYNLMINGVGFQDILLRLLEFFLLVSWLMIWWFAFLRLHGEIWHQLLKKRLKLTKIKNWLFSLLSVP